MASVLLTKSGSAGDQTELLAKGRGAGMGALEADEAASSFLALEEAGAEREAGGGGGAGRRGGAACACRLAGGCAYGALLALVLLALAAAVLALALEAHRGARCSDLTRDLDALRRDVDALQSRAADHDALRHDVDDLKHRVIQEDIFSRLRAFEDEVYQDEDGVGADGEGEDEDEDDGDLPPEDEGDLDYYPDSEAVEEEEEREGAGAGAGVATPGPEHRGRFHPQYEHLAHARPAAHPHKKPGTEALNAARAAAEEAAAEAAAASGQKAPPQPAPRHKREIGAERPPVLEESYGVAPNASEGLRLYETLVAGGTAPAPAHAPAPRANVIRSPPWPARRAGKEHRDTAAAATRRELGGGAVGRPAAPAPAEVPSVIQRQSRVMQTPMPAAPARPPRTHALPQPSRQQLYSTARASQVAPPPADAGRVVRVYQDQAPAALRSGAAPRLKKKSAAKKTLSGLRGGEEAAGAGRPTAHALRRRPVFAAHYGGDASSYKLGSTSHFEGNGKLRHPTQVFVDWSPASWMGQLNMDKKFNLQDGAVTVADSGLYFVYAQIHYLDRHDTNGFSILVNNASALQCTVTAGLTGGGAEEPRSNTCFTAGAMYLGPGDQVSVREVGSLRWTLFQPQKSFFGLVKLGHTARIT
ncbi:hypothetical protein R5R35_004336 [Gryllus longicercus]|uniref:THD domain-containing protein n=1 Tax=Gryllus longicercus TaxID=2509291 RepID=A0AAN9Z5B2_9ORTH